MPPIRVLAVGMFDSIHFTRWVEAASQLDLELLLVPSGPNRIVQPRLKSQISGLSELDVTARLLSKISIFVWVVDKFFSGRVRGLIIRFLIRRHKIDIVHYHEMQMGGYPLRFANIKSSQTKVFYSPYGSDMFWFGSYKSHRKRIRATLGLTDVMFPECERDIALAQKHGFRGRFSDQFPASGWHEVQQDAGSRPIKQRKKIMIKCYGRRWGGEVQALLSLQKLDSELQDYELHFLSAGRNLAKFIKRFETLTKSKVFLHKKFSLSSGEMADLMGDAKYYIALSKSDGFPISLFEALHKGVIPIQSDTACLPKSLKEINPSSFLEIESWRGLDQVFRDLEEDQSNLLRISNSFQMWTAARLVTRNSFIDQLNLNYGLSKRS